MNQQDVIGRMCRDKISKAEGICIGVVDWMFGCRTYSVRVRMDDKLDQIKYYSKEIDIPESCLEIIDPALAIDIAVPAEEKPKFFGKICKDKVTGYKGMCIGRVWNFYEEKQYCLVQRYKKRKPSLSPSKWFDEGRIITLQSVNEIAPEDVQTKYKGGVNDIALPGFKDHT